MEALMLDGNAVAGLLLEVFGTEMTTAHSVCAGCGANEQLGAVRVYRAAGYVLRCVHCEAVLAKLVTDGERVWLDLRGLRSLQLGG
jgi:hypothetical protein